MASCLDPLDILPDALEDFVTEAFELSLASAGIFTEDTWKSIGLPQLEAVFNIFGYTDEEIYPVQLAAVKLLDSDLKLPFLKDTEVSILSNRDLVTAIKLAILTGPVASTSRSLDYAKSTYVHGLPTSSMQNTDINASDVTDAIEVELGESITLLSSRYGTPTPWHWTTLAVEEGLVVGDPPLFYDSNTDWLWHEGHPPTPVAGDAIFQIDSRVDLGTQYKVYYTVLYPPVLEGVTGDTLVAYPNTGNYFYATYELDSDPGFTHYWAYEQALGTYPALDDISNLGIYAEDMLPIIPLRKEFENSNDPLSSSYSATEADTSRALLKILGLDYDYIIEEISNNPDIALIEDAFVLFGLNIYSTDVNVQEILYVLFNNFYISSTISKADYDANPTGVAVNLVKVEEQNYNASICYNYIEETMETGSIGPIGHYETEVQVEINDTYEEDPDTGVTSGGGVNSQYYLRKQITANSYTQLRVDGLYAITVIRTVIGTYKTTTVELSEDAAEQIKFVVPLSLDALDNAAYLTKERVVMEALHIVIYAADHVHLEWYETEEFLSLVSVVLKIIAIVILFYSLGSASNVAAALYALAQQLLIQYILKLALAELLEYYADNDAAKAAIIIAYLYASYALGGSGAGELFSAETLMNLVTAVNIDISIEAKSLEEERLEFLMDADERQEELENARDLLDTTGAVDPFDIISYKNTDPYENPVDFYQRTIHTGNPGVAVLDQIESFHDNLLRLPEIEVNPSSNLI